MKIAKLYLKTIKEPIILSEKEGKKIEIIKNDISIADNTPISIPNIWTGSKEDIRYIIWQIEDSYERKDIPVMDNSQFNELNSELDKYKLIAEQSGLNKCYFQEFWLQEKGAIRLDIFDSPLGLKVRQIIVRNPTLYLQLLDKLDSYNKKLYFKVIHN